MPPVALKDRIALLQQQTAADQPHNQPINTGAQASGGLKAKIANFERKGAVPIPRGSFGLGAPPVDDGSSKRKGELYGNRVPGLSKPTIESVEPNVRRRTMSSSHLSHYSISSRSATPPVPELPVHLTGGAMPYSPSLGVPRMPFGVAPPVRRTVSDVLPHIHDTSDFANAGFNGGIDGSVSEEVTMVEEPKQEMEDREKDDVKVDALEVITAVGFSEKPAIVVSTIIAPEPSPAAPNSASTAQSPTSSYSPVSYRGGGGAKSPPSSYSPVSPRDGVFRNHLRPLLQMSLKPTVLRHLRHPFFQALL
ncbi:hypothetical protein EUX98_g3086 [Antrodiella citrinella]|uniref:Uncharacterized protein n=1 Tax=Antrodiella citrinella TaxID=2447956 RepID=A0A4S4MXG3_9APHY|nr:hypothetical protein EUX98_g3086 [Antrodiella citrinella]